ncbi:hypothetical protein D3C77_278740 [compost metagenome]
MRPDQQARTCSTRVAASASPPTSNWRRPASCSWRAWPISACSNDGAICSTVICCSATICHNCVRSSFSAGGAITSCAPSSSGSQNSQTEASKLNAVFCSTRSSACRASCPCIHRMWLLSAPWRNCTPLGWPVEPEV